MTEGTEPRAFGCGVREPRRSIALSIAVAIATVLLVTACSPSGDQRQPSRSTSAATPAITSGGPTTSAVAPGEAQFLVPDVVGGLANVPQTLSAPIAECVVRNDTTHPVFHGCIDWHSAVHGNYALRVISRLTGDTKFIDVAKSVMSADGLRNELMSVTEGRLSQELPYGFAWFLILDREAALAELAPLAVSVSSQLRQWITQHAGGSELSANEYRNLSFAVFALHRWYLRFAPGDATALRGEVMSALAKRWREPCSQATRRSDGFFDACANLLLALSDARAVDHSVVDDADFESMLAEVTAEGPLAPQQLSSIHAAGLNFSRSWAIYTAALVLRRPQLVQTADDYFLATFKAPQLWRETYHSYSHWVAQFGVHALDLREQARQALLRKS
ncbi:MAG: hypothetical protein QOJ56_5411 [Mycobacterium sp.]|nr:hypothetical protein [Mycobacterium sp.]